MGDGLSEILPRSGHCERTVNKLLKKTYNILEPKKPLEFVPVLNNAGEVSEFERATEIFKRTLLLHPCRYIC